MTDQDIFEVRQTDVEIQEILDQVPKNKKAIEDINGKLPAEASPENPLADKEYVDGKVGAERTRAEGAESTLDGKIAAEKNRAEGVESTLDGKIAAENNRAQGAENNLQQAINTEASRAAEAERVLDGKIADEEARAEGAEQTLDGKIATEKTRAEGVESTLDGKITAEKTRAEGVETTLQGGINSINGKIPTQASSQNQLADKDFVNSTVGTNTANYISNNGQPFTSLSELQAYTGPHDNNDYAFVKTLDALGNVIYHRYKYSDASRQWALEYTLNNSSFTAAQWAAINSAITSGLTEKLNALPTKEQLDTLFSGKQDTISDLATIRSGAAAGATALQPAALTPYSTTQQMNTAINNAVSTEKTRAEAAEQALQTGKQAVILDLATIAMGSGVSHDDTYSSIRTSTIADFILLTNATVDILFTTPINAEDATLNVSTTGAKPLRILGQSLPAGVVKAQTYATLVYDGTAWNIVNLFCPGAEYDPAALVVDMGLPSGVKWAARDIDLTKPGGFCETPFTYMKSFFSWGNIDGHNPISNSEFSYNWGGVNETEPYYEGQPYGSTPGNTLTGNIAVGEDFDAARANLGAPWRMSTNDEYGELFANIRYINADGTEVDTTKADKRVSVNGILGLYLESKINGARLFFSCSGCGVGRSWNVRGSGGLYWSSSWDSARYARNLSFNSGGVYPQYGNNRYYGFALRPVQ